MRSLGQGNHLLLPWVASRLPTAYRNFGRHPAYWCTYGALHPKGAPLRRRWGSIPMPSATYCTTFRAAVKIFLAHSERVFPALFAA
jgi:hypothetical protein